MIAAFLVRTPLYEEIKRGDTAGGLYNGFVAFDGKLPLSMAGGASCYSTSLDSMIDVHGGITYDHNNGSDLFLPEGYMVPIIPLTALPSPDELRNLRIVGFNTLHPDDTADKWGFSAVREETLRLMRHIENGSMNDYITFDDFRRLVHNLRKIGGLEVYVENAKGDSIDMYQFEFSDLVNNGAYLYADKDANIETIESGDHELEKKFHEIWDEITSGGGKPFIKSCQWITALKRA